MLYFFTPSTKIRAIGYAVDSSFFAYLTKEGISVCRKQEKHSPTFYQLPDAKQKKYIDLTVTGSYIYVLQEEGKIYTIDQTGYIYKKTENYLPEGILPLCLNSDGSRLVVGATEGHVTVFELSNNLDSGTLL